MPPRCRSRSPKGAGARSRCRCCCTRRSSRPRCMAGSPGNTSRHRSTTLAIEATVVDERALKGIARRRPNRRRPSRAPEPAPEPEPRAGRRAGAAQARPGRDRTQQEEERLAQEKLEQQKREQEQEGRAGAEGARRRREARGREAGRGEGGRREGCRGEGCRRQEGGREEARRGCRRREEGRRRKGAARARGGTSAQRSRPKSGAMPLRNSDEASAGMRRSSRASQRAWIKPPSARPGISCIVSVTQVPGGEVTAVRVNSCSIDDAALRESVEAAVYRASPLPPPPDPAAVRAQFGANIRTAMNEPHEKTRDLSCCWPLLGLRARPRSRSCDSPSRGRHRPHPDRRRAVRARRAGRRRPRRGRRSSQRDLESSGRFKGMPRTDMVITPTTAAEVDVAGLEAAAQRLRRGRPCSPRSPTATYASTPNS